MLLTIFCPAIAAGTTAATVKARLGTFDLLPLTRGDVVRVLSSAFLEKPMALLKFARIAVPDFQIDEPEVLREVIQACLANSCKVRGARLPVPDRRAPLGALLTGARAVQGKLLKALHEMSPDMVKECVASAIVNAKITLDDVPEWNDDEDRGARAKAFRASFCAGFGTTRLDYDMYDLFGTELPETEDQEEEDENVSPVRDAEEPAEGGDVKMEVDSDTDEASTFPGTPSSILRTHGGPPSCHTPAAAEEDTEGDVVCDSASSNYAAHVHGAPCLDRARSAKKRFRRASVRTRPRSSTARADAGGTVLLRITTLRTTSTRFRAVRTVQLAQRPFVNFSRRRAGSRALGARPVWHA